MFRFRFLFVLTLGFAQMWGQADTLAPEQMRADLDYLEKYLRRWHPTFYAYTPKGEMDAHYASLKASCAEPLPMYAFVRTVRRAANKVGCGHIGVSTPKGFRYPPLRMAPFEVYALADGRLCVRSASDTSGGLNMGDELLAINGTPAQVLRDETMELAFTDGYNETHKRQSVQQSFKVFYFYLHGSVDTFVVTARSRQTGAVATFRLAGERYVPPAKVPSAKPPCTGDCVIQGEGQSLRRVDFDSSTMLLKIDHFRGARQGKTYRQMFRYLRRQGTERLLIDLRGNGGGSVIKGKQFLTYLLPKAILGATFTRRPNLTFLNPRFKGSFMERITPVLLTLNPLQYPSCKGWNHFFPFFKKQKNHFGGQLYLLTDGGTFSMASCVASYLKHKRGAVVLGEETGGSEYASRAMASGTIRLPHSGVRVSINVFQMKNSLRIPDTGHGVMPDFPVPYSLEDCISGSDPVLEKAAALVRARR